MSEMICAGSTVLIAKYVATDIDAEVRKDQGDYIARFIGKQGTVLFIDKDKQHPVMVGVHKLCYACKNVIDTVYVRFSRYELEAV